MAGPTPSALPAGSLHGGIGERSAWFRPGDQPAEISFSSGGTCEYLASDDRTDGRFGVYRWTFGDSASGPDPHFHRTISGKFYVLSGDVDLYDGTAQRTARPGDFLYVPEGGVHGFRGSGGASMLLMFAPGGPREDYFETLARGGPPNEERDAFMARHDTYWS